MADLVEGKPAWIVMLDDRHVDPEFWVRQTFEDAVAKAKEILQDYRTDPDHPHWNAPVVQDEDGDLPAGYWLEWGDPEHYGVNFQPEGDPSISVWRAKP